MEKLAATVVFFGLLVSTSVRAANPLGLYVGAGGGRADLRIDEPDYYVTCHGPFYATCFHQKDFGWTAFAGLQPLPFLGAELQYLDFGHASRWAGEEFNSKSARALALFGTGTLPLPLVDLYAKAGLGRLQTKTTLGYVDPNLCLDIGACGLLATQIDKTAARFGWGLGMQFKLSSLGLRAEYVRFSAPNGDPDLLSFALLWKF
jgi:opacity protein-like surface antigen